MLAWVTRGSTAPGVRARLGRPTGRGAAAPADATRTPAVAAAATHRQRRAPGCGALTSGPQTLAHPRRHAAPALVGLHRGRGGLDRLRGGARRSPRGPRPSPKRGHVGADGEDDRAGDRQAADRLSLDAKVPLVAGSLTAGRAATGWCSVGVVEHRPVEAPERALGRQSVEDAGGRSRQRLVVARDGRVDLVEGARRSSWRGTTATGSTRTPPAGARGRRAPGRTGPLGPGAPPPRRGARRVDAAREVPALASRATRAPRRAARRSPRRPRAAWPRPRRGPRLRRRDLSASSSSRRSSTSSQWAGSSGRSPMAMRHPRASRGT